MKKIKLIISAITLFALAVIIPLLIDAEFFGMALMLLPLAVINTAFYFSFLETTLNNKEQ